MKCRGEHFRIEDLIGNFLSLFVDYWKFQFVPEATTLTYYIFI